MDVTSEKGKLYIVATPIGNLGDISSRALSVLSSVDLILAEDTRTALKLFRNLGIHHKRVEAYHDHSDEKQRESVLARLAENQQIALISDAGTPCVSDPGYKLIRDARAARYDVIPIPGASASLALISAAGLPTDRVMMVGFLAHKESAVINELEKWKNLRGTSVIFFNTMRRLGRDLAIITKVFPEAQMAVGRELTKVFEEIIVGSPQELLDWYQAKPTLKGEVSCMIYLPEVEKEAPVEELRDMIKAELAKGATLKDLLRDFAGAGLSRSELYKLILEMKNN